MDGYIKSPHDQRDIAYSSVIIVTEHPRRAELKPALFFNQGQYPTCVGAAGKIAKEILERCDEGAVNLSAQKLFDWCKEIDGLPAGAQGTHPRALCTILVTKGVPEERLAPYTVQTPDTPELLENAALYKILTYAKINTLEEVKHAIGVLGTPVLMGAQINYPFRTQLLVASDGRLVGWHPFEPAVGGHEMVIVGYDEDFNFSYPDGTQATGMIKIQTSWVDETGKPFGDAYGCFWIPTKWITFEVLPGQGTAVGFKYTNELHTFVDIIRKGLALMFSDVENGRWSKAAIDHLTAAGIISGYPEGTFRPEEPLTREQFAQVVSKLLDKLEMLSRRLEILENPVAGK